MASTHDIRLPADSLLALRRALGREVGADAADRALQEAGHAAGDSIFHSLEARIGGELAGVPRDAFWDRLGSLAQDMEWGTLEHRQIHPGVGALTGRDWFEVDPEATRAYAPFTTGMLANILGRAADGEVAVLQVPCPEGGRCVRFLFGAPAVLERVYSGLRQGSDVDASLAALG